MENDYYKKVEEEKEVVVKELNIEKEKVNLEETKVQQQIAETLDKGKILRSNDDKDQKASSGEPETAGSYKDGESNKLSLKLLQTGEISPKTGLFSLEERNNILEQTTSEVTILSREENTPGASVSSEIKQKTSEADKPGLKLLQLGEIMPETTVLSLDEANNHSEKSIGCEIEQTTSIFVEEDKPGASSSLEIDQKISKAKEVVQEEDRHDENSSPLESGGSKSEAGMSSLRSEDDKIQNSGSFEEMTPKTTVLSLQGGNNNPEISDQYEIEQIAVEAASLPVEEDKLSGAPTSLEINQETSEARKASHEEDRQKENASSSWSLLETDSTSVTVTCSLVNRNDVIDHPRSSETVDGCSKQSLTTLETENGGPSGSRKRLRKWTGVVTGSKNISESFSSLDISKKKNMSRIEEQNVPVINKKPSKREARKLRRKLIAQKRQSERFQGQGVQKNSGNLPKIGENISINKGNQLFVPKEEILSDNEEILPGNQGDTPRTKKIFGINKVKLIRKQRMLPKNPENLPENPVNHSSNQINQGIWPSSQGNQQHPPLNQGNFSDVPSTLRVEDIPDNSSGRCSLAEKRKRNSEDSSSQGAQGAQGFKRSRHSERDLSTKFDLRRIIIADDYRRVGITEQELGQLRIAISQEIDQIQGGPIPKFTDAYLKFGGIVIESADLWSRDWLTYIVPKLYPWTGAKLKVVDLSSLEKFYKAVMWIPGPLENPEFILGRLEKQNPTLKTAAWRIHFGEGQLTKRGYNLFLGIPESSARALREINFKPFLGLTKVTISISKQEDPEGQGFNPWR